MGAKTDIEWTAHTWNPWWGCLEVSPGCDHCYARELARRFGRQVWRPPHRTVRMVTSAAYWRQPLAWNRAAAAEGRQHRVFCASMADVFEYHPQLDVVRARLWELIAATPWLDWQLLTKRPMNLRRMLSPDWLEAPRPNVRLGASVEDQPRADLRLPHLVYTDTHGYTVTWTPASLLGKSLAPCIARMHEQTLYKLDRSRHYPHLDPILDGTVKPHLVRRAWDETVRVVASIQARTASPSLILHRLGSYARQHSVHQALNEIGRVDRTVHILRTIDEEDYRRRQGRELNRRELNKGEAAHDLSRFLFFGKQGELRGRSFDDQFRSFSCLGVLHNAVVAWNIIRVGKLVEQLRAEGHVIDDATLALTTPLMHKHLNPFGRYHFDLARMRQTFGRAR